MISLTINRQQILDRLQLVIEKKVNDGCIAAAEVLREAYKDGLQENTAPPHSEPGQVPHAYMGHKTGGFGPLNKPNEPNNTPKFGFARVQTEYLSNYISATRMRQGASVGFIPSHVPNRYMNYLIGLDQGRYRNRYVAERPWILPIYRRVSDRMAQAFMSGARK